VSHIEEHFAIAISAVILEVGDRNLDRRFVKTHVFEDLLGKPEVAKAGPVGRLDVASLRAHQSINEPIPTAMAG
jgi:hypothetical protein